MPQIEKPSPSLTVSERLAGFALGHHPSRADANVQRAARLHVLDTIGCGLAAVGTDEAPFASRWGRRAAPGKSSVLGVTAACDASAAAMANGMLCHALDFDDTHGASIAHVSTVVVPAALAAAEAIGAPLGDFLDAVLVGNEVTCRIGNPVGDAFHRRGFHPTAVCGVFGATAAVGRLLGTDSRTLVNAFGIAGSMASGLLAYLTDGSSTKRIHPGWMAHAAHTAVGLADLGATGPAAVIEGTNGVYQSFLGLTDVVGDTADLGARWTTPEIAFKPYPVCHFMHTALDAVRELRSSYDFGPQDIAGITVFNPKAGVDMVLAPLERKHRPATAYEGKFSAPYAIAALLHQGRLDVRSFDETTLRDDAILETARKVDYAVHEYETFPASFSGGVRVRLHNGSEHELHLPHQRGGAQWPMTDSEVQGKFRANARLALGENEVEQIESHLLDGRADSSLASLEILRKARGTKGAVAADTGPR